MDDNHGNHQTKNIYLFVKLEYKDSEVKPNLYHIAFNLEEFITRPGVNGTPIDPVQTKESKMEDWK